MDEVRCWCQDDWWRPSCFSRSSSLCRHGLCYCSVCAIVVVRSGEKKFLVSTWLLLTTDVVGIVAFFKVRATSSVVCRFRLRTTWKPSSFFGCPAWCLHFRTAFSSFSFTVYIPYSALNKASPLTNLQLSSRLSFAELTIAVQSSLWRTTAGVKPERS
jgi:hypothetical protein